MNSPDGRVRIFNTDQAVLEAGEPRQDLPCQVTAGKTLLGFDLRFHAAYEVTVPLKELAGNENLLTILFRVTDPEHNTEPLYFLQKVRVPSVEEEAKGDAYLQGSFDLGEGRYHVDWLMRDRHERICASSWDVEASLPVRDKDMELSIPPATIRESEPEGFREEPPVLRLTSEPLHVKVLVNFAPQRLRSASLQPVDTTALVSILRTIARDPRIGKFSVVAFNLQDQRVVHRQDGVERVDFPALGEAVNLITPGLVDVKTLAVRNGETEFLTELIRKETAGELAPDALIFAGPKALLESNVAEETLRDLGELSYPVFYMNYNLYPQAVPWRDAIGHCVKFFKGTEFTISRPRDLWYAVSDMVSRIVKLKHGRRSSVSPTE